MRPNILFLMTDQQRADSIHCAGNERVRTPNIDRLAQTGMRFAQATTSTPVCVPARMSLITGKRNRGTGFFTNNPILGGLPENPTLMTLLRREGYYTTAVGKMHFRGCHYGLMSLKTQEECVDYCIDDDYILYLREHHIRTRFPLGIRDLLAYQPQTVSIPEEHSPITWVTDQTIQTLRLHARYRPGEPFFHWASWIAPHLPFAPCEPYDEAYDPADMVDPYFIERPLESMPSPFWKFRGRAYGVPYDPPRMRRLRALYHGQIAHVDHAVGRVLNALEELGFAENTIVVFFSDHGEMLGDHGLSRKSVPYEPAVRVPLIIRWPGKTTPGSVSDAPVSLIDILPTFVSELDLQYPAETHGELPGASLFNVKQDEFRVIDYGEGQKRWVALRSPSMKYVLHLEEHFEELYDLKADPEERRNLASCIPLQAKEFRKAVVEWERVFGSKESFDAQGELKRFRKPPVPPVLEPIVTLNQGRWPHNLPDSEKDSVESFAEAFTAAIRKETTLTPEKLPIRAYKEAGGESLAGTPWEDAWNNA